MGLPDAITSSFPDQTTTSFCLYINFEGQHDLVPESQVYALNADGEVIAKQRVDDGKALFTLSVNELQGTTMLIGPPLSELEPPTRASGQAAGFPMFNPTWQFEPGTSSYSLPSVPENMWRWWLVRSLYSELQPERDRPRRFLLF